MRMTLHRLSLFSALAALGMVFGATPADAQSRDNQRAQSDYDQSERNQSQDANDGQRYDENNRPSQPSEDEINSASRTESARAMIEDFDDNGDGALSRNELPRRMRGRFEQIDQDGNGRLSRQELAQRQQRQQPQQQQQSGNYQAKPVAPIEFVYIWVSDADHGHLSLNELQRAYDTLQKVDKDNNGELSKSELRECREQNVARWTKSVTNRLDDNDDNRISRSEARGTLISARFDDLDENGDDQVNQQELKQCVMKHFEGSMPDEPTEDGGGQAEQGQASARNDEEMR